MLGISDFWIASAYALCLLSAVLCVVYGVVCWNKGGDADAPTPEDQTWEKEEEAVEETL